MNEKDYILVSELARIRSIIDILKNICPEIGVITKNQHESIMKILFDCCEKIDDMLYIEV